MLFNVPAAVVCHFVRWLKLCWLPLFARRSIGKSVRGRDLWVIVLGKTPDAHVPRRPEVKYSAGLHGNEMVGSELLLKLASHLCDYYTRGDYRVIQVLVVTDVLRCLGHRGL